MRILVYKASLNHNFPRLTKYLYSLYLFSKSAGPNGAHGCEDRFTYYLIRVKSYVVVVYILKTDINYRVMLSKSREVMIE